jgi:integrase
MSAQLSMISLFENFINDSYKGKRLRINGQRIKCQTVDNYKYVLAMLKEFEVQSGQEIFVRPLKKINKNHLTIENRYWKTFYKKFCAYLYRRGCCDNYAGFVFKTIRSFFVYLNRDKLILTSDTYKKFYVRKEEIPVITLAPEQLQFLIHDQRLERSLSESMMRTKDLFVFGCSVALRFSDLLSIRFQDIEERGNFHYLCVKTKKTEHTVRIKLPIYALDIVCKYRRNKKATSTIFPTISKNQFNKNLKKLFYKAGFNNIVGKSRTANGRKFDVLNSKQAAYSFSELASSHLMRRTAITTMLLLGMAEIAVKKVSGHSLNSKAFYRYVNYVQAYLDHEIDKFHSQLMTPLFSTK